MGVRLSSIVLPWTAPYCPAPHDSALKWAVTSAAPVGHGAACLRDCCQLFPPSHPFPLFQPQA